MESQLLHDLQLFLFGLLCVDFFLHFLNNLLHVCILVFDLHVLDLDDVLQLFDLILVDPFVDLVK